MTRGRRLLKLICIAIWISQVLGGSALFGAEAPVLSARSFSTTVCRTCGSPVPRLTRDGQHAVVPAGSLDDTPSIQPTARIFWDSRTPWSCAGDDLTRFPESPA